MASPLTPLRLMIVDDSTIARAVLSRILSAEMDFRIVAMAGNAAEAVAALNGLEVDIVLLDVEMPGTSGLDALPDIIRAGRGARVLIVSSMAEDGAEVAVRALALGAEDTLPKPGRGAFGGRFGAVLVDKVRRIGRATRLEPDSPKSSLPPRLELRDMPEGSLGCIALGASTGGLHPLIEFLRALPARIGVPVLVTQHLPDVFMPFFARQLETAAGRPALVAQDGMVLAAEHIHVAPGGAHLGLARVNGKVCVRLDQRRAPSGCRPSADPMLAAVAEAFGSEGAGIILSGMGRDGLIGARRLIEAGGVMLAQDRKTAAIWGMPRVIVEEGLAAAVGAPAQLARRLALRIGG
ncbi:MAG: chemotaxis protein CheB [Sphingosinicella sp.]